MSEYPKFRTGWGRGELQKVEGIFRDGTKIEIGVGKLWEEHYLEKHHLRLVRRVFVDGSLVEEHRTIPLAALECVGEVRDAVLNITVIKDAGDAYGVTYTVEVRGDVITFFWWDAADTNCSEVIERRAGFDAEFAPLAVPRPVFDLACAEIDKRKVRYDK